MIDSRSVLDAGAEVNNELIKCCKWIFVFFVDILVCVTWMAGCMLGSKSRKACMRRQYMGMHDKVNGSSGDSEIDDVDYLLCLVVLSWHVWCWGYLHFVRNEFIVR